MLGDQTAIMVPVVRLSFSKGIQFGYFAAII